MRVPEAAGTGHARGRRQPLPDQRGAAARADRLSPLCRLVRLTVPPASIEEHYSDWARLVRELSMQWQALLPMASACPTAAPLGVLRNLAGALREQEGKITLLVQETAGRPQRTRSRSRGTQPAAFSVWPSTSGPPPLPPSSSIWKTAACWPPALPTTRKSAAAPMSSAASITRATPERLTELRDFGAGNDQRPDRRDASRRPPRRRTISAPRSWPATPP